MSLQLRQTPAPQVELQEEFARAVAAAIDVARERGLVKGELTPGDLLRMPQAFVIRDRAADEPNRSARRLARRRGGGG